MHECHALEGAAAMSGNLLIFEKGEWSSKHCVLHGVGIYVYENVSGSPLVLTFWVTCDARVHR